MSIKHALTICLVLGLAATLVILNDGMFAQMYGPGAAAQGRGGAAAAPAQAGGRGGGAPAAAAPAGGAPGDGPMLDFLGPIGNVPATMPLEKGTPKAPSTDTYYIDGRPFEEMPPDEFISNPDSEFDWHTLKAWHIAPILKSVKIIGNRVVRPGDTVTLEAEVADPTGTTSGATLSYYGPQGRRTTLTASFRPIAPGSGTLRATLTIPRMAEPGIYRHIRFGPSNEVRSSKAYFSDYHPAMRGQPLEIQVLPSENVDVIPPEMHWVKIGSVDATGDKVFSAPISDPIPIFAQVSDNKSGVNRVNVRFNKLGTNKFQDVDLKPLFGQKDIYVGYLTLPAWWDGGEYQMTTFGVEDKNTQDYKYYFSTNPWLAKAKFNIIQDPKNVDSTPPKLVSIWVESESGTMGQPVTVSAIIVDDKSGVGTVSAVFQAVPSYQNNARVILRKIPKADVIQKSGFNTETNLYQGQLTTGIWQEPGRWQLMRIVARDNADNFLDMLPENHPEFAAVAVNFGGGQRLREKMLAAKAGNATNFTSSVLGAAPAPGAAANAPSAAGAPTGARPAQPGAVQVDANGNKLRRVDMTPPHPPRGACLNCHEP